jgi:hypothetical protein
MTYQCHLVPRLRISPVEPASWPVCAQLVHNKPLLPIQPSQSSDPLPLPTRVPMSTGFIGVRMSHPGTTSACFWRSMTSPPPHQEASERGAAIKNDGLGAAMTCQVASVESPFLVGNHPLAPVATTSMLLSHRRQLLFLDLPALSSSTSIRQSGGGRPGGWNSVLSPASARSVLISWINSASSETWTPFLGPQRPKRLANTGKSSVQTLMRLSHVASSTKDLAPLWHDAATEPSKAQQQRNALQRTVEMRPSCDLCPRLKSLAYCDTVSGQKDLDTTAWSSA